MRANTSGGGRRDGLAAVAVLGLALALLYLFVDVPLARACAWIPAERPRALYSFIVLPANQYGQGFSIALVIALMLTMSPSKRKETIQLVIGVALAAGAVHFLKMTTGRARPETLFAGGESWRVLEGWRNVAYTSFPSAHTTTAFALTAALSSAHPKGRWVFYVLGCLCAIARVVTMQHFASDVVAGAALGMWLGYGACRWKWAETVAGDIAFLRRDARALKGEGRGDIQIEGPGPAESAECEDILRALPGWFGVETALVQYARDVRHMPTFVARHNGRAVGFVTIEQHNEYSAEIHVIAVRPESRRQGTGKALLGRAEQHLVENGTEYLQVKTLAPSHPDEGYGETRAFYEAMGFRPLEEIKGIWNSNNPCLVMVKRLPAR